VGRIDIILVCTWKMPEESNDDGWRGEIFSAAIAILSI
jgi:hypothetical protein